MGKNKVVYNGNTLIDLTSDTVSADNLMSGITAHNAAGEIITGIMSGGSSIQMASGSLTYTGGSAVVSGLAFTPVMVVACVDISTTALGNAYQNTMWGAAANTALFTHNATQYDSFTRWGNDIYAQRGQSVDAVFTQDGFTWAFTAGAVSSYTLGPLHWWAFGGFEVTV